MRVGPPVRRSAGKSEPGRRAVGLGLLLAILPAGPLAAVQCPDGAPPPCRGARSAVPVLVVMPLENRSPDNEDSYLAETMSEDLTSALSRAGTVRLLSAHGSRRGAEYVLAGRVQRLGSVVRASGRLERAGTREIVWTGSLDRPVSRSTDAAEDLAAQVLRRLGAAGDGVARRPLARPVDPLAWDLYLRGRYHGRRRVEAETRQAVLLFRQAVARDSTLAPAWAGLAAAMHYAQRWRLAVPGVARDSLVPAMLEASERALLADSNSAETWTTRALVLQSVDPTSRSASLVALRRALRLDSLSVDAWTQYSFTLAEAEDSGGALSAGRRAVAVNPSWPEAVSNLALLFYWRRQYDSAAVWADSAVATDPTFLTSRRVAGTVALAQHRLPVAEAQFAAARAVGPGPERIWSMAGLVIVAVGTGDSARARQLLDEMMVLADTTVSLHTAVFVAWAWAALGDNGRALDWLERYQPDGDLHFQLHLRHDAPLDPLRGEPRFQRLVRP